MFNIKEFHRFWDRIFRRIIFPHPYCSTHQSEKLNLKAVDEHLKPSNVPCIQKDY